MIGASGHKGVQFAEPRDNGAMEVENISNGAFAGVGAVSVRSSGEAMQRGHVGGLAEVIRQTKSGSAF